MSLEKRLIETLHEVDRFEPSPDLFARVNRSLSEAAAHRRRLLAVGFGTIGSVALMVTLIGSVTSRNVNGRLMTPVWSIEIVETLALAGLVLVLAPVIRRFGDAYVLAVFHLDPTLGPRFLRLLDLAYYLTFLGAVVATSDVTGLSRTADLATWAEGSLDRVAGVLMAMGVLHVTVLLSLPVVGLIHSSTVRRSRRQVAGAAAPPVSSPALRADTIASRLVWALAAIGVAGVLLLAGVALGFGFSR
jgi:hypothetical protein